MTTASSSTPLPMSNKNKKAIAGWVLFDWAAQPFFALVTTFIFAPYFANSFVGDPVKGQAYWGYAAAIAGMAIAILSPIAGSISDVTGKRKPWIAVLSVIFVITLWIFWWAEPGPNAPVMLILAAFVIATICAEMQIVFTNAIMPTLVPRDQLGRLSGFGWAAGYVAALITLILYAACITTAPGSDKTLLGFTPIFPLDANSFEAERLSGPFCAIWFIVFATPFFLWTTDNPNNIHKSSAPLRDGLNELWATLSDLKHFKNIALFLIARLCYVDGISAIFVFGGIYGTAIFDWTAMEIGLFGITITVAGTIGALAGGPLDDKFGPKPLITVSLLGLLIGMVGILSIDKDHILFSIEVLPKEPTGAIFASTGERAYILFGLLIGLVSGPIFSASRTLLADLAPKEKLTQFYGLYAFSGKVTSFAAPLLVAYVTALTESQRWGIAPIVFFILAGLILLTFVRTHRLSD